MEAVCLPLNAVQPGLARPPWAELQGYKSQPSRAPPASSALSQGFNCTASVQPSLHSSSTWQGPKNPTSPMGPHRPGPRAPAQTTAHYCFGMLSRHQKAGCRGGQSTVLMYRRAHCWGGPGLTQQPCMRAALLSQGEDPRSPRRPPWCSESSHSAPEPQPSSLRAAAASLLRHRLL